MKFVALALTWIIFHASLTSAEQFEPEESAEGIKFIDGKAPFYQPQPNIYSRPEIQSLSGKNIITLDVNQAELLNPFSPDQYEQSDDGAFVTDMNTGHTIPLVTYYMHDHETGDDVTFSIDPYNGNVEYVRIRPKDLDPALGFQIFEMIEGSFAGYYDTDVEVSFPAESCDDPGNNPLPEGWLDGILEAAQGPAAESSSEGSTRHRQMRSFQLEKFGHTCQVYDAVSIVLVTDTHFADFHGGNHESYAQTIFNEASVEFWRQSCILLWISQYRHTGDEIGVRNTMGYAWEMFDHLNRRSGCGEDEYGAMEIFKELFLMFHDDLNRDFAYLFTGIRFEDLNAGCAWRDSCQFNEWSYGMVSTNHLNSNFGSQVKTIAHELGHSLSLVDDTSSPGCQFIMQQSCGTAPSGFDPANAAIMHNRVVGQSNCGYF